MFGRGDMKGVTDLEAKIQGAEKAGINAILLSEENSYGDQGKLVSEKRGSFQTSRDYVPTFGLVDIGHKIQGIFTAEDMFEAIQSCLHPIEPSRGTIVKCSIIIVPF